MIVSHVVMLASVCVTQLGLVSQKNKDTYSKKLKFTPCRSGKPLGDVIVKEIMTLFCETKFSVR